MIEFHQLPKVTPEEQNPSKKAVGKIKIPLFNSKVAGMLNVNNFTELLKLDEKPIKEKIELVFATKMSSKPRFDNT